MGKNRIDDRRSWRKEERRSLGEVQSAEFFILYIVYMRVFPTHVFNNSLLDLASTFCNESLGSNLQNVQESYEVVQINTRSYILLNFRTYCF